MAVLALAAGGTGGHMFPAQALAQEMRRRGHSILLLTDDRGMRYAQEFPADHIVVLDAANPNVSGKLAKLSALWAMGQGVRMARRALKRFGAHAVVGFGGYPSAPGLVATRTRRLPYAVHEQNAVLGRVNRRMAPGARFVAHGFERLDRLPPIRGAVVQTGNPVRDAVAEAARMTYPPLADDGPLKVLIFGGSQGASLFARIFPPALASLPEDLKGRLEVTHQVSDDNHADAEAAYSNAGIRATLAPFFSDLPTRLAESHFVISRSGASTISELGVIGRPALLVPLGIAMDDHQRGNAEVLVSAGAADMLLEAAATSERAAALLLPRLRDAEGLAKAAAAARGQVPADAVQQLADRVEMDLLA